MKKILDLVAVVFICTSCGDSESDYIYSINNQTNYDIILCFEGSEIKNQDSILCAKNQETIIFQMEIASAKNFGCIPLSSKEYMKLIIDDEKNIIKDFSDVNNWECTGEEDWSLIMVGSYYSSIKSTFLITEDDLE